MQRIISPSFLSADFLNLSRDAQTINRSRAEWFHLDIMDGCFVPNLSYGMPVIKALRSATDKVLDVHLMIEKPERYIHEFRLAGADILTVHVEASVHLHRTLQAIKAEGMKAAIALNPATSLSTIEEVAHLADMVLLMSVNPGFGGQQFIPETFDKIRRLRQMLDLRGANTLIQVDGGVTTHNAAELFAAGANVLVAGSAVFGAEDPLKAIEMMLR